MILNLLGLLILVLVAVALGWLTWRAWHTHNSLLKWVGGVLGTLVTLLIALVAILMGYGLFQLYSPRSGAVENIKVQGTPEQVARGQHLAAVLCASCHTTNTQLPLTGGRDIADDSPLPIGHFYSVNLTPAGPLKDWSDGEILRTLREGIDRDGHPLLVMSSNGVRYLSEEDKQAIIAYLRSQPPTVNDIPSPPDQPNLLLALLVGLGIQQPRPALQGTVSAPPPGATAEYGKYLVSFNDCDVCHGKDLTGGTDPVAPHGPNLRLIKGWTEQQFIDTLRNGRDPGGHQLSDAMPWKYLGRLDDVELGALYTYLHGLP